MSGSLSPRVPGQLALAGAALVAGLASGHPELVVLGVPFLLFIGVGLVLVKEPEVAGEIELERVRLLEGEHVRARLAVHNEAERPIELELGLTRTGHLAVDPAGAVILHVAGVATVEIEFALCPQRWGAHAIGPVFVRVRDPLAITTWDGRLGQRAVLKAFPREERLRELVEPQRTQPFLATHVARRRGEGIEFADIRPFAAGDRVRQVNWRTSARRGALYVTERHPEHASDVVLLLDTFEEARAGGSGTLDVAVRAAASLARAHLARRDRVALVDFGGTLHWLEPALGSVQLYRIIDGLLSSEIAFSYAWREVESIPRKLLPTGALILALTPLLDPRSIRLMIDLRARGSDVTVIEVSPLEHAPPGPSAADAVAFRLWRLQRDALRARLQALGIGVALWEADAALAPALEGVNSFRRSARSLAHV